MVLVKSVESKNGGFLFRSEYFPEGNYRGAQDFQHSILSFAFIPKGRLSGLLIAWLIDYVFLNTGRTRQIEFQRS